VLALSDDGRELTVRCGLMRLTLELAAIEGLHGEKPSPPEVQVQVKGQRGLGGRGASVRSERNTVDVRGLRVHEAEAQLEERLRQVRAVKPDLVIVHISGYGQSGPYRDRPAFGVIGEAMGGLRHLTDHPPGTSQLPPVRVGVSIGDSIAGLYAAFGAMAVLWSRDRVGTDRVGLTVDVALTESILSMMEGMLPEYGALGRVKQPSGGRIVTAAPSNLYPTADGHWILIAANSDPLFAKLSNLIGRPELAGEMDFIDNPSRVANADTLDQIIGDWTRRACLVDLLVALNSANIPCSKVYTAADCAEDPQYRHRGMVREVADPNLGAVLQAGIVPHIPELPGQVRWSGPVIGYHNQEILVDLLELDNAQIESLREQRAI